MKKFTSLLMLFCMFVGTALAQVTELSQLSNDKIYALKSGRCFLLYSQANDGKLSTSTATAITDAERVEDAINNPNQQFKIQNTGGVYYLYSVGAAKYVTKDGSLSADPVDALEIHDVRANFPNYPWKLCIGGNGLNTQVANQMACGITVNGWTTADAGNTFQIVDIEEKPLLDALNELSTLVNNAKQELSNKYKVTLQTSDANAPFYLSATVQGDAPISAAIDNNPGTHYGSTWGSTVGHHHYWQVDLVDAANLEEFTFSYITRKNGSDTPTKINVQGSTDGEAFTDIVVLTENLPRAGGSTYASAKITNNGYRYIRFEVPSTTNNYSAAGNAEQEVTIAIAEFSLSDANADNYSVNDKNKANAISAAEEVLNASDNTLKNVQDAIVAFNEAMVVGQCTVSYSFIYNGVEKLTQEVDGYVGEEYPAFTLELPLGVSATKPAGVIDASDVDDGKVAKTIELTVNLPFVAAADYASINNWYYLKFHATALNYLYYAGTEDVLDASKTAVDASNKDAYTWAFVGNPFDGFKVVNKLAGESKAIVASASGAIVSEGADNVLKLTASTYGTNGFFMQATTGEKKDRFNKQGGKVVYWTGADAGSTFMAEERDLTGRTELQALVDAVEAAAPNYVVGEGIGYHTQASVDAVAAAVAAAKTALAGTMTGAIAAQHQTAINNAVAALVVNMPTPGALYRIKNVFRERFVSVDAAGKRVPSEENNANASLIWTVEKNGDVYMIKNLNYGDNGYMKTVGDNLLTNAQEAAGYSLVPFGEGQFKLTNSGSNFVDYGGDKGLGNWSSASKGGDGAWIFEPATELEVTVTSAGYATINLPFDVTLPNTVKAYAAETINDGYVTLTEKADIPANTGALLEGEGTHTLTIATATSDWTNNKFIGTNVNSYVEGLAYVLANGTEGVGLYKATLNKNAEGADGETHFLNNANKAYLPVAVPGARFLGFDFGTETGIGEVETETENAVIFDLAGRRVQKAQKGLYIVNGKKVIR